MNDIVPYVMYNGAWSLTDEVMAHVFNEMQRHGLDKVVFFAGEVTSVDQWLKFVKYPRNVVHTIWADSAVQTVAWLNNFGTNHAFGHFCCFPQTWGKTSIRLMRDSLDYWFNWKPKTDKPLLDVILGEIPAVNKIAISFAKRVGMTELGVVPEIQFGEDESKKVGAVFLYLTRRDFYNGQQKTTGRTTSQPNGIMASATVLEPN